jgi:glycosyltransferase involved in cell wall biosynthesis
MKLSIIIPAYNEGKHIFKNLNNLRKHLDILKKEGNIDYEIILVSDGSTDNTYEEVKKLYLYCDKIKAFHCKINKGKGYALKYGFGKSSGDFIIFIDADGDLSPHQIETFLEFMKENKADVVVGSKRHPMSRVDYPLKRRLYSRIYQILIKALFNLNIRDTQVGLKLYKRKVLKKIIPKLLVKRYATGLEAMVVANHYGFKITEVPIELKYNFSGTSINWKQIWHILVDTAAIFYRLRILYYYDEE